MFIIPPKIPINGFVYMWYIQMWKLLNGVIGFICLIYSSLSWFIFALLVSMAFELHSQIFPTLILTPLQPLKSPYDSCYAYDPSGGEWEDIQACGRSFPLEWIWAKHIPFKHLRVKCLFPWGSTYLVYSIFKWKCWLSNCKLFKNACSWYTMSFEELGCSLLMVLQPWCFLGKWIWVLPEDKQKLSVGEFDENAKCHIFLP